MIIESVFVAIIKGIMIYFYAKCLQIQKKGSKIAFKSNKTLQSAHLFSTENS